MTFKSSAIVSWSKDVSALNKNLLEAKNETWKRIPQYKDIGTNLQRGKMKLMVSLIENKEAKILFCFDSMGER